MPGKTTAKNKKTSENTSKRGSAKASSSARASKSHKYEVEQPVKVGESNSKPFRIRKTWILAGLAFIILGLFLWFSRSLFVAEVINGQPISRLQVVKETEKQAG